MATHTNEISNDWPTVYDLAKEIGKVDLTVPGHMRTGQGRGKGNAKNWESVVDDLIPRPFPTEQGVHEVTPEQLASLKVPLLEKTIDNRLRGFQRQPLDVSHARKIARDMMEGTEINVLTVSVFPDGKPYITDGQHRSVGAVISRTPVRVDVKRRTVAEARELFTNQRKAKKLSQDSVILSGTAPLEEYIQDAIISGDNPWHGIIGYGMTRGTTQRQRTISPTTAAYVIGSYVYDSLSRSAAYYAGQRDLPFDRQRADELANLIRAFGTRKTNPLAFKQNSLRAISTAALMIFIRNENPDPTDRERWNRHMATFAFEQFPHLLSSPSELAEKMIQHWNKRLHGKRRVDIRLHTNQKRSN